MLVDDVSRLLIKERHERAKKEQEEKLKAEQISANKRKEKGE